MKYVKITGGRPAHLSLLLTHNHPLVLILPIRGYKEIAIIAT